MQELNTSHGFFQCEDRGDGPALLLIHGGISSEAFKPLLDVDPLVEFRKVVYRRRAYNPGYPGPLPVDITADAADGLELLELLGIDAAHVVGHSHGALVAVEMARRAPKCVMRLGLIETGLAAEVPSAARAADAFSPGVEAYQRGDGVTAADLLSRVVFGDDYASKMAEVGIAPSDDQIKREIAATFESDLPAQGRWTFAEAAASIDHDVLSLVGAESDAHYVRIAGAPLASEVRAAVTAALPQTEHVVIPGANHLMQIAQPDAVGLALARFLA